MNSHWLKRPFTLQNKALDKQKNFYINFSWATMVAKNFEIEEALLKIENDKALLKSGRHVEKQFNTGSASPKRFGS